MKKKIDIIVSCFNERDNIFPFFNEVKKYLTSDLYDYNVFFVDDGSTDGTYNKILELKNLFTENKISVISFLHNFGHESAMCAGLDISTADYMLFIDADLQNPPNKIPEIMEKFEEGADTVLLRKEKYNSIAFFRKLTSKCYYLFSKYILQNKNARDVSDFFAIDRLVADKVKKNYRTTLRFMRSFVQNEAKNIKFVNYETNERINGVSRYDYIKLIKLAIISELSRLTILRNKYKETKNNPIYVLDDERTI